ncbi:malonyl-CoA synthase [Marinobacter halodurans]|uniref:Malonyl-CoA synthase n=1 Tax=Marinobacter halodurans TaxID=2528979 RepID=A0ABY1ZQB2_9GAMM|nr:malonyl-CoA synthase [Marinobacter halodurans]TBW57669.1 malonyl-CoA synthase [Marinobacter halodurans]
MNHNLFATFDAKMRARGGSNFITTPDGKTYSYAEALATSERIAGALKALGVEPGDRVAVQVDKSPEVILLYLACLRVGGVYLPLNTGYTAEEVGYFLGDAEPALFVCRPEALADAQAIADKTGCPCVKTLGTDADGSLMEEVARAEPYSGIEPRGEDDLAAILYTSGTTGRSKGAMLTHRNLGSNCESLAEAWRFTDADRLIHALPIFHTHGLFVACNVILISGGRLYFMPKFDIDQIIEAMPDGTALMGVPTFYTRLLQDDRLTPELTRNMRLFTSGSAPLTAETHQKFQQRTGHAILERYGMTETNMNTSNPYDGPRIAGTVGMPLPGVRIRITDPESGTHEPLPQGEIGMLEVSGPNVFKGYWRMPEKTRAELLDDGYFVTGDLALIDDRGYVQIVGRDKDLVISGGFNVYPKEVEQVIDEMDGVVESAVIGVPHPDFGEGVTAVVVLEPNASVSEADVIRNLSGHLAKYKLPKLVFFVDALPRNTMGKVQKKQLRDEYKDIYTNA